MAKRLGGQTLAITDAVRVMASASVAGKREGEGPLKARFDLVSQDSYFGQDTWEKAEIFMLNRCFSLCLEKARGTVPDCILGGDLLN